MKLNRNTLLDLYFTVINELHMKYILIKFSVVFESAHTVDFIIREMLKCQSSQEEPATASQISGMFGLQKLSPEPALLLTNAGFNKVLPGLYIR